jgi:predicted RNA polymerase sigma factor
MPEILPRESEARALLPLMLLQDSRSAARVGPVVELVLLGEQYRSL